MTPPGHLAAAYLLARRAPDRLARAIPIVVGTLSPDLIDKSAQFLGLTPYGRTVGHSLALWGFATALLFVAHARRLAHAPTLGLVVLGGLGHLGVDLVDDVVEGLTYGGYVFSAWMGWPFSNPDVLNVRVPHLYGARSHAVTVLEVATVLVAVVLSVRDARAGRPR